MLVRAFAAFVLALATLGAFQIQSPVPTNEEPMPHCYPCPPKPVR